MKQILAAILVILALGVGTSDAKTNPAVSVRALAPAEPLAPGKPANLTVELTIASPYHINSDRPLEDFLIPTTLEFEPHPRITFGKPVFPAAPEIKLPFSETPMSVYEGIVRISVEIVPAADLAAETVSIKGRVRYQACDNFACLPPAYQSFSLELPAGGAATGAGSAPLSVPQRTEGGAAASAPVNFDDRGILATFLLVFLGGLALNLTPCVYPMIPITISYFGGQAQGKKGSIFLHALLYVIGMAVTYSALGVVAAMTGGLLGAALQHPPVLIAIALVMVLLALSMFDLYELRLPAFLNRLAGGSQKGFGGTFLMGLTVGIVAAPCIGPFVLGLLTYVGNKGSAVLGFSLFFVLALGLGLPFLILGAFSGSIRRLPRSGAWMVWVRKIFGFILLAMAAFFLKTLFPSLLAYQLTLALIMLLAGIYLAWIDPVEAAGKAFRILRNLVGIVFFAIALYAAVTGIQQIETPVVQPDGKKLGSAIEWLPYSEEQLRRASSEGRPVFIDFFADWCAPCKELDKHTFAAPEVVERSRQFVMLKVDLTSEEDPRTEALRSKYQVRGVPTLVFLDSNGQEMPDLRGNGFEPKDVFLDKMNRALDRVGETLRR